ncbi:MAG: hypothetical protein RR975_13175, partial [Clostridia bacterium]
AYFSSWGSCVAMFHNHQWLTSLNEAGILLAVLVGYTFVMGVLYLLMLRRIKRCDLIFDSGEKA